MICPTVKEFLDSEFPMNFSHDFNGSCTCCKIIGLDFTLWAHCWRSGCPECNFSGVHVTGKASKENKHRIAQHFIEHSNWKNSTEFNIVLETI